jgi:hypothetical protein
LVAVAAAFLASFRDRAALHLEILALRHQLSVLQRSVKRPKLTAADRFLWAWLSAVWEDWQPSSVIMKPATVVLANLEVADKLGVVFLPSIPMFGAVGGAGGGFLGFLSPAYGASA